MLCLLNRFRTRKWQNGGAKEIKVRRSSLAQKQEAIRGFVAGQIDKCADSTHCGIHKISRFFSRAFIEVALLIDSVLHAADWKLNCSYGGLLQRIIPGSAGYPLLSQCLIFAVLFFVLGTPSLQALMNSPALLAGSVSALSISLIILHLFSQRRLVIYQASSLAVLCFGLVCVSLPELDLISLPLYPNAYMIACGLLSVSVVILAWPLSVMLFRTLDSNGAREALLNAELPSRHRPEGLKHLRSEFSPLAVLRAMIIGPVQYNVRLLLFPSLLILLVRDPDYFLLAGIFGLACSWLVFSFASLHSGINNIIELTLRAFFRGAQGVLSIVVIALALGRISGFSYVASMLDSSPAYLVLLYILAIYALCLLYEYWINRLLTEEVLRLLRGATDEEFGRIVYCKPSDSDGQTQRSIQIHGGSRLAVSADGCEREVLGRTELFQRISQSSRLSVENRERVRNLATEILHRIRFYFVFQSVLVLLCFFGLGMVISGLPQAPAAAIRSGTAFSSNLNLRELIFDKHTGNPNSAILLSCSGGGSRAALFSSSILHGLWKAHRIDDLVLVSGVSGGSASLSYFAAHYPQLRQPSSSADWTAYEEVMAAPFIEEVLANVWDWKLLLNERLGHLLKVSFDGHFFHKHDKGRRSFGDVSELALILNASIAGHEDLASGVSGTRLAGGIFSFTNLRMPGFPARGLREIPGEYLRFIAAGDPAVELSTVGAVSANFPPVFPNAAVDLDGTTRYWLTDGGAVENRGILALLYALRRALQEEKSLLDNMRNLSQVLPTVPAIDVLVGEASAENLSFYQDRGIGSSLKASRKFVSQLVADLWQEIEDLYVEIGGKRGQVRIHNIAMPLFLRSNGGIGTHWLVPRQVVVRSPVDGERAEVFMSGRNVRELILALHDSELLGKQESDLAQSDSPLAQVWQWAKEDNHQVVWSNFLSQ